jgi:hypothetical protein
MSVAVPDKKMCPARNFFQAVKKLPDHLQEPFLEEK